MSTMTRVTFPAATSPPWSLTVTVNVSRRPSTLSSVASAATAEPTLVGWRWSTCTRIPTGQTTVGMRVQVDHLHPTNVGSAVAAEATLDKVEGRRLTFTVTVNDHGGLVAAGKVTRVIVDTEQFLDKAR